MNNFNVPELVGFSMIAGDFQEIEIAVNDGDTLEPVDLTTFNDVRWVLFRYGDAENPLLNLTGEVVAADTSRFTVSLLTEYTRNLEGLYVQQPQLIDSTNKLFVPAQGQINIIPRGKQENSLITI